VSITCLVIASLWDLRSREVPDFLSYTFIGTLCIIALYNGMYVQLLSATVLLAIGWAFVYGGAWGGADAKLLPLFAFVTEPFTLAYWLVIPALFTVGAVYGIIWVLCATLYHYQGLLDWVRGQHTGWILAPFILGGLYLVYWPLAVMITVLVLFTVCTSYLYTCEFSQSVNFRSVVPGDWLMQPITVNNTTLEGLLTENDARLVHRWGFEGLITNVQIKYGIPFIPAFLFTYLLYFYKDYVLSLM